MSPRGREESPWSLEFCFLKNVGKKNESPARKIMRRKNLIVWRLFRKHWNLHSIYWRENWRGMSQGLSQGHTCDLVQAEHTGPELLPSSPVSFSITPSWLFVNINLVERQSLLIHFKAVFAYFMSKSVICPNLFITLFFRKI